MICPATVEDTPVTAQIHVESWRSTYRGLMPDAVLDDLSVEKRAEFWGQVIGHTPKQFVFVETADRGNIIGFVNGRPEQEADPRYTAELYTLYLLREQQGSGYGGALPQAAVDEFTERGHRAMLLWVLATNPAHGFYEKLGGVYLKSKPIAIGDPTLEEVAYGWGDLPGLAK